MNESDQFPIYPVPPDPEQVALQEHYEQVSRKAAEAMKGYARAVKRLVATPVIGRTRDRRIEVQLTAAGELVAVRLHGDTVRRYSHSALGDMVTRVLVHTQQQARERYQRQAEELIPSEVTEAQRLTQEMLDRAAENARAYGKLA